MEEVELDYEFTEYTIGGKKEKWLKLYGGPTGYEEAKVSELQQKMYHWDWAANMLTQNTWDGLVVPQAELIRILKNIKEN